MQQVESRYDKQTGVTRAGGSQVLLNLFTNHHQLSFFFPSAAGSPSLEQEKKTEKTGSHLTAA